MITTHIKKIIIIKPPRYHIAKIGSKENSHHFPHNLQGIKIFIPQYVRETKEQHTYQSLGNLSRILFGKDTDINIGRPS